MIFPSIAIDPGAAYPYFRPPWVKSMDHLALHSLGYRFPVDKIHGAPVRLRIQAEGAALAELAQQLKIPGVEALRADVTISPGAEGFYELEGQVEAELRQTCVVTLEEFVQSLSFGFSRRFAEAGPLAQIQALRQGQEAQNDVFEGDEPADWLMDFEAEDEPDALIDGAIPLAAALAEELALNLDPYPRKPGAVLPPVGDEMAQTPSGRVSPFANLKQMMDEKRKN